jgi:hypothetical protein
MTLKIIIIIIIYIYIYIYIYNSRSLGVINPLTPKNFNRFAIGD